MEQLVNLSSSLIETVANVKVDSSGHAGHWTFVIEGGERSISLEGVLTRTDIPEDVAEIRSFKARYSCTGGGVSSVDCDLDGSDRELSVAGTNGAAVDGVITAISEKLLRYQTFLGSGAFNFTVYLLCWLLGFVFIFVAIEKCASRKNQILFTVLAVALGIVGVVWLFSNPIPGFLAYEGDPSWVVRNPFLAWFIGIVLTFVLFGITPYYQRAIDSINSRKEVRQKR